MAPSNKPDGSRRLPLDAAPADAIDDARARLALLAAAIQSPTEARWTDFEAGAVALLLDIDERLIAARLALAEANR